MANPFSGRAVPLFIQNNRTWFKLILLSIGAAFAFSIWGCPGFLRLKTEVIGRAALFAILTNSVHLVILSKLRPAVFTEDRWTFSKELLFNSWVVVSCLLGVSLTGLLPYRIFPATEAWFSQVIPGAWVLTVSVTASHQFTSYRKNHRLAERIKAGIRKRNRLTVDYDPDHFLPVLIGGKETQVSLHDIVYLHNSAGQTTVAILNPAGIRKGRSTVEFKSVREHFRKLSNFYRCHRDWMVNMDKVTGIRADALGFMLETESEDLLIPVSSSLNRDMEGRLMK